MNEKELRKYIKLLVTEVLAENPAAPSQLVSKSGPKGSTKKQDEEEDSDEDELEEFSGVGAIAGYTLPLGMPASLPVAGSKSRKKFKRKKPSWA